MKKQLLLLSLLFGLSLNMYSQKLSDDRLFEKRNRNKCSSEYIYVLKIEQNGKVISIAYYCENEVSIFNSDVKYFNNFHNRHKHLNTATKSGKIKNERYSDNQVSQNSNRTSPSNSYQNNSDNRNETLIAQQNTERQIVFETEKQELLSELKDLSESNSLGFKDYSFGNSEISNIQPSQTTAVEVSYGQIAMTPAQRERALKYSRDAYKIARRQIDNYSQTKSNIERDISLLEEKNKNSFEIIHGYEKLIAILEYKQMLVVYYGIDTFHSNNRKKEQENLLKQKFNIKESDIAEFKKEVDNVCKKIVFDMSADSDAENKYIDGAVGIAQGTVELSYSNPKNEIKNTLAQIEEVYKKNEMDIFRYRTRLRTLEKEYTDLKNLFSKYGYNILNSQDESLVINFGNDCREALTIRIEEQ